MSDSLITLPPNLQQRILRLVGLADSTYLGNDMYYRCRIVDLLIHWIGEEYLNKEFKKEGKNWEEMKKQISFVAKKVAKTKPLYDLIEDKKFAKVEDKYNNKQAFAKEASRIPLINNPITYMYVWFLKRTSLQRLQVPSENYKILEHTGLRALDTSKKSLGTPVSNS